MARERGTFNFSASLEIKKEGALDARLVVNTKAELTQASTWLDDDNKIWLYNGLLVCVVADTDINNGVYFLIDKDNYTTSTNWVKIGSISGSTPDELLEAINNALEEAKAYTDDKAGTVTFTGSNYITNSGDLTEAVIELDDLLKNIKDTYLPLSGGTMTGIIKIPYNGLLTSGNKSNSLIFYNDTELWYGSLPYRAVFDTSNTDMIHRKNGINHIIYDESNFVAGTDYLAPGNVTIADISDLGSTWDSYLKAGVYDRNITVNGTTYPVMTDVSGATAINIYAPTAAGTPGQFLKATGGSPTWANLAISDISGLQTDGDGSLYLANDGIYKEVSALSEQEIYTLVPSATANEANASVYTLVKNNSNVVVVYKDNGLFFPISWKSTTEGTVMGSAVIYNFPIGAEGSELDNWISYDIDLNSEGVCYCTQRSLTDSFKSVGVFSFQYSPDNAGAIFNEQIYPIIHGMVGYTAVAEMDESSNTITKHIGKITKTPDNVTIVCTEENTQITYVCTPDGNMTKQEDNITIDWSNIVSKPSTFTPSTHTHTVSQITDFPTTWNWNNISDNPFTTAATYDIISSRENIWLTSNRKDGVTQGFYIQGTDSTNDTGYSAVAEFGVVYAHSDTDGSVFFGDSQYAFIYAGVGKKYNSIDTLRVYTDTVKWGNEELYRASTFVAGTDYIAPNNLGTLTFTGAVTGTFTGLNDLTINIPTSGGTADSVAWDNVIGKPAFATVATSGSYNDLTDKPSIPSAYTLPTASSSVLGGIKVGAGLAISGDGILSATGGGVADSVDIENVEGLNSSWLALLQTAPTRYVTADPTWEQVSGKPVFASVATSGSYDDLTDKPTIPSLSGYATQSWVNSQGFLTSVAWDDIQSKPSSFTPNTHTHPVSQVTGIGTITFTGAVNATYNGTQDISVNIPTASGGVADSVDWSNVTNKPNWIGSSKPTYSFSEISGTIAIGDLPTGTTGSTVALGNHTHSNYLTSSSLSGYATQSWVQDQGYLTSVPAQSWSSITDKPSWIGSSKPSYSYSEISGTVPVADLPIATTDTAGAVRVGAGLTINSSGVLSATGGGTADAVDLDNITGMNSAWKTLLASAPTRYVTSDPTWSQITEKPSSFTPSSHTHSASDITSGTLALARIPTGTTSSTVALGDHTHDLYLTSSSLSSYATQTWVTSQINGIDAADIGAAAAMHTHVFSDITFNNTGTNSQYLAGDGKFYTIGWNEISGKPSTFSPSSHTHSASDITSGTLSISRLPTGTTSSTVALGNHTHSQYLTSSSLSGYATETWVNQQIAAIDIPDTSGFVTLTGAQTISGAKTFTNSNGVRSTYGFYDTSDIRLKSNIQDIELKDKINLYEFDKQGKHSYGVIAQEVEQLYPSVVNTDENGYKTVNYNEVLSIKCAELEAENKELKARLDKLEALVNSLL